MSLNACQRPVLCARRRSKPTSPPQMASVPYLEDTCHSSRTRSPGVCNRAQSRRSADTASQNLPHSCGFCTRSRRVILAFGKLCRSLSWTLCQTPDARATSTRRVPEPQTPCTWGELHTLTVCVSANCYPPAQHARLMCVFCRCMTDLNWSRNCCWRPGEPPIDGQHIRQKLVAAGQRRRFHRCTQLSLYMLRDSSQLAGQHV